ncbi:MAG: alpha/beta hydrolase [Dermatophilaceae bacterium]
MSERPVSAAVEGGALAGTLWHEDAAGHPVLGLSGITANHRSYAGLAPRVDVPLLALDSRGRGRSRDLPPPYSLVQHADDTARALDDLGIGRVLVVGHSMGAFVATRLAERHPDRVAALVLVDGGLPLRPPPPDARPEDLLGPAIERLRLTFESTDAYRDFWRGHPAFGPYWNEVVEDYVDYDLQQIDGALRPSAHPDAVLTNLVELDGRDGYADAVLGLERRGLPRVLLTSPRGLFDEPAPLYDADWLATWTGRLPGMRVEEVPGTNHYTILLGSGVDAVARAIQSLQEVPA